MTDHPASTIFPLMDGVELAALADDIRAHGLLDPIVLCDGQVLDGRNRLRACELAGVDPSFAEWEPDGMTPTEWVVSHNLHRRHLTTAQRAALAVDLLPRLEEEARERMAEGGREFGRGKGRPESDTPIAVGRSDEKAAEIVGIGRTAVADTKAIQRRDPEIVNRMRSGDIPSIEAARRAAGFEPNNARQAPISDSKPTVYFGKGDKWREATQPLTRYLKSWGARDFQFGHVNPAEAAKRMRLIDELIEGLIQTRNDLKPRSVKARSLSLKGRT